MCAQSPKPASDDHALVVPSPAPDPFTPRGNFQPSARLRVARPLLRACAHLEVPGYGRALRHFGVRDQHRWTGAPWVQARERVSGCAMRLDLADYYQRIAYFMGCYHERHIQRVLRVALREGDTYIDGGANIGLTVLAATRHVGNSGVIHAFEPSPLALASLRWHVEHNHLTNVHIHEVGLSDRAQSLTLTMPRRDNIGGGTLGPLPARHDNRFYKKWPATTARGDDILDAYAINTPALIKLDVEGFEHVAIQGLTRTIETHHPAIVTEVNAERLRVNGSSPGSLYDLASSFGYTPFAPRLVKATANRSLRVHWLDREELGRHPDVLFLHPDGPHWQRFARRGP